jgi:hypothetical protein
LVFSRHAIDVTLLSYIASVVFQTHPIWGILHGLNTQFLGTALAGCRAILAWIYLTGSRRLGVVDLFACEIITLCRVFTIMDAAPRLIAAYERLKPSIACRRSIRPATSSQAAA